MCYLFLIFVFILQIIVGRGFKECENSACVSLTECSEILKDEIPDPTTLLRNLTCGFDELIPKICCHLLNESNELKSYRKYVNKEALLPNKTVCGVQYEDKIYHGTLCDIDEHPWMAMLQYTRSMEDNTIEKKYYCGGVLISSNYVLTAAHCVKGILTRLPNKLAHVRLGEWNTSSEIDCHYDDCAPSVLDVAIEEIIPHEEYNEATSYSHNDIALLRLKQSVTFSDFVKPICLPFAEDVMDITLEDRSFEVAGWGLIDDINEAEVKLKAKVPVSKNEDCKRVYDLLKISITDTQICAGGGRGNENCCKGDSGGGLFGAHGYNWFLFGIVSFGPTPCGHKNTLGFSTVFTRVTAYRDWILSNIKP